VRSRDLVLIAALALGLRLFALWAIPLASGSPDPNCAPDEAAHFWVTRDLAQGRTPTWPDGTWTFYGAFPPSQYAVHAVTLALGRPVEGWAWLYRFPYREPQVRGYPLARLGSALLGVLTVVLLSVAAGRWTGSRSSANLAGIAAACFPQLVFIGAYTNADAFTIAVGALLVVTLVRWAWAGESEAGLVPVGAAAGMVVLGKVSGYFLLPPLVAWLGLAVVRRTVRPAAVVRAVLAAGMVCGPLLVWNGLRNQGDVLGVSKYMLFLKSSYKPRLGGSIPGAVRLFVRHLAASSFGTFGNMGLPLPKALIVTFYVLLMLGLVAALAQLWTAPAVARRAAWFLMLSSAINLGLVVYCSWFVDFDPQGRYVLLSIVLLTIVSILAPLGLTGARVRLLWPLGYTVFLAVAAVRTEMLLYSNPCLP